MTSKERIETALNHREPDRIPIDFGGHLITSIHIDAYKQLLDYLDLSSDLEWSRQGDDTIYRDEWGISWRKKGKEGLYFEHYTPFYDSMPTVEALKKKIWPDYSLSKRIDGLPARAESITVSGKVPILDLPLGLEIFDGGFNLCGSSNFYMLLALNQAAATYIMDRQLEEQIAWWSQAICAMPELTLVRIGDDLGAQESMLIDPEMYRALVLPRHQKLFKAIKDISGGRIKIIMHSDGAVLPVLPDLIDAGIDCLNPIQYTVRGIDPVSLKKKFGKNLTFWGGAVDSQNILPHATPGQVKDEVKRQIEILAPDGGFVFSPIHILQKDVPPENIVSMMEAAIEFGKY